MNWHCLVNCQFSASGFEVPDADQVVDGADVHASVGNRGGRVGFFRQGVPGEEIVVGSRPEHFTAARRPTAQRYTSLKLPFFQN